MGLFYSTYAYLASFYQPHNKVDLTQTKIKLSAAKLIHYLKLQQATLQDKTKKIQVQLLKQIEGPQMLRNLQAEEILIHDVVSNSYRLAAYQELIVCAKIIQSEAKMIEKHEMSKNCQVAVCSVLYAYQTFNLGEYIQLEDLIAKPYPNIPIQHISDPLRDCLSQNSITKQAENIYVLEMCYRNNLELEKVNSVGHKFIYNPSKYDRQSKSSFLFALEIDENEQMGKNMVQEPQKKMEEQMS